MTQMAIKPPMWKKFIVAQAGAGVNGLSLRHMLPLDAFRVYLAIPRAAYERYIDPKTSKGGAVRGFEVVREVANKPFPGEAVILRQTNAAAEIHVADHAKDKLLRHGDGARGRSGAAPRGAGDRHLDGAWRRRPQRGGRLHGALNTGR